MLRINNIKFTLDDDMTDLKTVTAKFLKTETEDITKCILVKKAVDARKKSDVHYVCSVNIEVKNEDKILKLCKNAVKVKQTEYTYPTVISKTDKRPVVVGFGPGGMFAALTLAQCGMNPIVLERGSEVDKRRCDISEFWTNAKLNTSSNVQFGEGGAGTFSDGKLTTGIKDVRCRKVLEEFVRFDAPEEILYLAKPHIGTDNLRIVVKNIRNEIIRLGGEIHFDTLVKDIITSAGTLTGLVAENNGETFEIETDRAIFAVGHSARDTFEMFYKNGINMCQKPFSVGARIEHSQQMINKSQYGKFYNKLPSADYKLSVHLPNGRSAYTFCMCPGGLVVGAASETNTVVTNGMSNFARNEKNANSALLVGVNPIDFGDTSPLAGIEFQRKIERAAFKTGGNNYFAPVQLVGDFLKGKGSKSIGNVEPSYRPGVTLTDLKECLPRYVIDTMKYAISEMDKQLNGFALYDAVLTGTETRSSSPVRIIRDSESFECSVRGIIPCGEGAGYAGGIMSAAVDGIKCAEKVMTF